MFEISPLRDSFAEAKQLLDQAIGVGWFTTEKLQTMSQAANGQLLCARDDEDALLGVASVIALDAQQVGFYRVFGDAAQILDGKRVGALSLSALIPSMRGKGLGSAMMRARLTWLRERDCNYAVGISWLSGLTHTSKGVFERYGFEVLAVSHTFFEAESREHGYGCPACGFPCRCTGLLYGLAL
jgi:GNAT superfamily N-acetyltransferase